MSWGSIPTSSFNKDGITTGYLQSDSQALAFFWPSDKGYWPANKLIPTPARPKACRIVSFTKLSG